MSEVMVNPEEEDTTSSSLSTSYSTTTSLTTSTPASTSKCRKGLADFRYIVNNVDSSQPHESVMSAPHFPPKVTVSGTDIRTKEVVLVSMALLLLVFSLCLFFKHWKKNYRDINQLPYYAYLYDKAVPEVTIKVKPRPPTSTAMATAALAAAMANANAFTIVYPTKTTGTNKLTQKSSNAKITSQIETSPALTKPLINEAKKAKFTRRQTEYFNSSRIPSLNRRNSLYMPELEPFEEPFETVIALENSPAVAPRQQRLSSIISNDDETEAALEITSGSGSKANEKLEDDDSPTPSASLSAEIVTTV